VEKIEAAGPGARRKIGRQPYAVLVGHHRREMRRRGQAALDDDGYGAINSGYRRYDFRRREKPVLTAAIFRKCRDP